MQGIGTSLGGAAQAPMPPPSQWHGARAHQIQQQSRGVHMLVWRGTRYLIRQWGTALLRGPCSGAWGGRERAQAAPAPGLVLSSRRKHQPTQNLKQKTHESCPGGRQRLRAAWETGSPDSRGGAAVGGEVLPPGKAVSTLAAWIGKGEGPGQEVMRALDDPSRGLGLGGHGCKRSQCVCACVQRRWERDPASWLSPPSSAGSLPTRPNTPLHPEPHIKALPLCPLRTLLGRLA